MLLNTFSDDALAEAGCDEAGRGCYAGPVCAAAVILPRNFYHPLLNDSKLVTVANRNQLRSIIEQEAITWAVTMVSHEEIDCINILQATYLAMHKAIDGLSVKPDFLLIDGNCFKPYLGIAHHCIVKGDGKYAAIAAASILAKTHRDAYMQQLHQQFPQYNWQKNKGYGTAQHRAAIQQYGLCKYHRQSFAIAP